MTNLSFNIAHLTLFFWLYWNVEAFREETFAAETTRVRSATITVLQAQTPQHTMRGRCLSETIQQPIRRRRRSRTPLLRSRSPSWPQPWERWTRHCDKRIDNDRQMQPGSGANDGQCPLRRTPKITMRPYPV